MSTAISTKVDAEVREEVQLACFRVGEQLYALNIMSIREIIRPLRLTAVPKAPPFIEGVINLRGAVIPVVDLRRRFDLAIPENDRKTRVLITSLQGRILGLQVDDVTEVRRYNRNEVLPAPHFIKGPDAEFFLGVCRREDELILILNLEKILSSEERIDLADLDSSAPPVLSRP